VLHPGSGALHPVSARYTRAAAPACRWGACRPASLLICVFRLSRVAQVASAGGKPVQAACGGPGTASGAANASSFAPGSEALHAFDGNPALPWVSNGGYRADGTPTAGPQWVQLTLAAPAAVRYYSVLYSPDSWPSMRRRPRAHALMGAPSAQVRNIFRACVTR